MTPLKTPFRHRSPRGKDYANPIFLRLTTEERERLERIASMESRSLSAQARLLVVDAMQAIEATEPD